MIERIVRENGAAWRDSQELPSGERLNYIHWIMVVKREGSRIRRVNEAIVRLAEGTRLGLK
jgi:uncharacterized protein YdeI (YjbR/CyaY-like superfamily)